LTQQKKPRKVGRPKLPKGEAKGRIVPVRFANDDLTAIEAAAKSSGQTTSEWVRTAIYTVLTSKELVNASRNLVRRSDELLESRRQQQAKVHSK
jgi:hypothetical protein